MPHVTVVVTARNEEKHLEEALTSILEQKKVDLEVVFVDDFSTDNTWEVAKRIADARPNLQLVRNKSKGKVHGWNLGVSLAKGDFICLFAGDDAMPPGSLQARLDYVRNISSDVPVAGLSKLRTMSTDSSRDNVVIPRAKGKGGLSGVCPLLNRSAAELIFPVPETLPNEDTWMQLCILSFEEIVQVHNDVIACNWRIHSGNSILTSEEFNLYSAKLAERNEAFGLFLERNRSRLTPRARAWLESHMTLEKLRRDGAWFSMLFVRGPLIARLRSIATSRPIFHKIRQKMFRFVSGW